MGYLRFDSTEDSPEILLDAELSIFQISGSSTPEDVNAIYLPVEAWIKDNEKEINNCLCKFFFRYLSSSSHHKIFNILGQLNDLYNKGHKLTIEWAYESIDDDMLRLGLDFASILDIPFEFNPRN